MERSALVKEAGIEERSHYEESHDPALRQVLEQAHVFAETIVQCKFSPIEREAFSKIIRQFNTLYWEMALQTWMITRWRGVPVFKPPTDLWIYQELMYSLKPDVIIETGTCAGGSALFLADMMSMMRIEGRVITIDIDCQGLHEEFTRRLENNELYMQDLVFLNGSSVDPECIRMVKEKIRPSDKVAVILDSDHSYEHVTKELELYAPLVTKGSALIIEDTSNTETTKQAVTDWYLDHRKEFKQDVMCEKFMLTFSRDGFYERTV